MGNNKRHSQLIREDGIHTMVAYLYATEAERLAATGFTSVDLDKLARVEENDRVYILTGISPITWEWLNTQGLDPDAIHVNVDAEIDGIDEKVDLNISDIVVIEDSETTFEKKKAKINSVILTERTLLDLTPGAEQPHKTGRLYYSDIEKCFIAYNDKPNVSMNIGEELWARVINDTGSTILNGQVVYVETAIGSNIAVNLPVASDKEQSIRSFAVATEDIANGEEGYVTRYGAIRELNTSTWAVGDVLYLSTTTPGAITNVRPVAPDYIVRVGVVLISNPTLGVIGVDLLGFNGNDTSVNIEGALNGNATQRHNASFVVDTGIVYADIINEQEPSKDLPILINLNRYFLNTTSGAGVGGAARVPLTPGTVDNPQVNYIYVEIIAGNAVLKISLTFPSGVANPISVLGIVSLKDVATTTTDGVLSWQRFNNSSNNGPGNGILSYIPDRIRAAGAVWENGVMPAVSIVTQGGSPDNVNVTLGAGLAWQLHNQSFDGTDGTVYYIVNHPTDGVKRITDLNEITVIADGSPIGNDEIIGLNIFGCQSSEGVPDICLITLPEGVYPASFFVDEEQAALNDANNFAVTSIPSGLGLDRISFRVCRLVLRYLTAGGGTWQNVVNEETGEDYQDERGQPQGTAAGGGSGQSIVTNFPDNLFTIFNNLDPTKVATYNSEFLTPGAPRVYNHPDKDGTIALLSDAVDWIYPWVPGTYRAKTMTRIGGFTTISNKETSDYPVPEKVGEPEFVSGLGDSPPWSVISDTEKLVLTGQRYTAPDDISYKLNKWRLWVEQASTTITYEIYLILDPTGSPIYEELMREQTFQQTGWIEINVSEQFIQRGLTFDIVLLQRSLTGVTTQQADWDFKRKNDSSPPSSGEAWMNNNGRLRISHTDDNSNNQETLLDSVSPGDKITFGGIEYDVLAINPQSTYNEYTLDPQTRPSESTYTFTFTIQTAQAIDYVRITDHFISNANIRGFFSDSGLAGITLDDDAYGIDIEIQEYIQSDDWDIVGTSEIGGGAVEQKFKEFLLNAPMFDIPNNADWAVNDNAELSSDTNNNGLTVTRFDDTAEEGVGFVIKIPLGATNIIFDIVSRAETAPGSVQEVAINLYNREILDNSAVESWSTAYQFTDLSFPTNENFQYDTETIPLSALGITAGNTVQFELTRDTADADDTLTGDWSLLSLAVRFS